MLDAVLDAEEMGMGDEEGIYTDGYDLGDYARLRWDNPKAVESMLHVAATRRLARQVRVPVHDALRNRLVLKDRTCRR